MTEYGNQFLEKQRIRFSYGITERQLSNYVKEASQKKAPAETLYEKLENRLDNVIYRMGLANTRALARQMVSHGHIMVNKKKLNIPSYQVRVGDEISVRPGSQGKVLFQNLDKKLQNYIIPEWLKFDTGSALGKVLGKPKNQESFLDFSTALEFYSR
jgi:small subunit ribosomal protein S4